MKRSLLLFAPVLFAAFVFSCKKEDSGEHNTVATGISYRSLDEAINSTAPVARSTSFGVASGDTIVAPGGTAFLIPPNAFETLTGGKVTGSVNITVNDWLLKGDMVFGRVLPLSYGEPLLSGGEAYMLVTQNGQPLRIKKTDSVMVLFPQYNSVAGLTTGWVGRTMTGSANTVNWVADTFSLKPLIISPDTITVRVDTLPYIQPASLLAYASYTNFTVRLNSPVTLENTMAIALYDNNKSVFPLPAAQNSLINAMRVPTLASPGEGMHIAVMGISQGRFYGGIAVVPSPASDSTYTVIMKAMEPPTLKLAINLL